MFLLSETHVRRCLLIEKCITANKKALESLGRKKNSVGNINNKIAIVPPRIGIPYLHGNKTLKSKDDSDGHANDGDGDAKDMTLFKPAAYLPQNEAPLMGLKVVSVRANNASIGKSLVPANILLLNAATGEVTSMVAATYLTAARTAAGSTIATELCLNHRFNDDDDDEDDDNDNDDDDDNIDANAKELHLVFIGAGLQAELHMRYLYHLPIMKKLLKRVTIVNRSQGRAESLKESIKTFLNDGMDDDHTTDDDNENKSKSDQENQSKSSVEIDCVTFQDMTKVKEAVTSANVIVACTNTAKPLFNWDWVSPGCHINGVGSYSAGSEEVCSKFVKERCLTMVDTIEALQVGDLKEISNSSSNDDDAFLGLVGDVLSCDVTLPSNDLLLDRCTFYKSVGTAIQDIITAEEVVESAKRLGLGITVDMS